jgi:hypothetical protein
LGVHNSHTQFHTPIRHPEDSSEKVADACRRRFDAILVWKIDRFGRSLKHLVNSLAELAALGVAFISLRDNLDLSTPSGRLRTRGRKENASDVRALSWMLPELPICVLRAAPGLRSLQRWGSERAQRSGRLQACPKAIDSFIERIVADSEGM